MKKVIIYFITFVLMISIIFSSKAFATAEGEEVQENIETDKKVVTQITKAVVSEIGEIQEIQTDYMTDTIQKVKIEILDGEYKGKEYDAEYVLAYDLEAKIKNYELKVGDEVTVQITDDGAGTVTAQVEDIVRTNYVILMLVLFLIAFFMITGKQGIKPVLSLIIIALTIYFVLLKGIYAGNNAILMTFLATIIIVVFNSIIMSGLSKKTITLIIGILFSTIISGIIGYIFIHLTKISGISENIIQLSLNMTQIEFSFRDIVLVSTMISSIGLCMNIGMFIVNKLDEQKDKTADISRKEIIKDGIEFGKKLISNQINTITLIFIGISISLLLAFLASNTRTIEVLNKESVIEIIVVAFSVCLSALFSIPIISANYAVFNHKKILYRTTSENKLDGNRSLKI